jgi:hypothetical protein
MLSPISASFGRVPFDIHGFILLYFVRDEAWAIERQKARGKIQPLRLRKEDRMHFFAKPYSGLPVNFAVSWEHDAKEFCGDSRFQQPLCSTHPTML